MTLGTKQPNSARWLGLGTLGNYSLRVPWIFHQVKNQHDRSSSSSRAFQWPIANAKWTQSILVPNLNVACCSKTQELLAFRGSSTWRRRNWMRAAAAQTFKNAGGFIFLAGLDSCMRTTRFRIIRLPMSCSLSSSIWHQILGWCLQHINFFLSS